MIHMSQTTTSTSASADNVLLQSAAANANATTTTQAATLNTTDTLAQIQTLSADNASTATVVSNNTAGETKPLSLDVYYYAYSYNNYCTY